MNDSPKKQGGKKVARRDEIIREAALLFLDSGYRGASMETLAERVGIAKPTLYHYFRRKEDILYEIHKLFVLPLLEQQQLYADRRLPPDDQLRRAIRDMLAAMREDRATSAPSSSTGASWARSVTASSATSPASTGCSSRTRCARASRRGCSATWTR